MPTSLDTAVLYWLIALGYKLYGRDEADIQAMFEHEAAQWGLAPDRLAAMIRQDFDHQGVAPLAPAMLSTPVLVQAA
ncbi:MAG: hypothetical protein AAF970_05615 [Bacteroidota bacterium]